MNKDMIDAITDSITNAHKYIVANALSFAGNEKLAPFEEVLADLRGVQTLMLILRAREAAKVPPGHVRQREDGTFSKE